MNPAPSIAILLFTRTPEEEARCKTWVPDGGVNVHERLAGAFIRNARRVARQSGLPLYVISSDRQVGETFGERLSNAFSDVFSRGHNGVIAIGNDALGLSADDLKNAAEGLHHHDAVLGATHDGGAYLIGLSRSAFEPIRLAGLPWETPSLLDALVSYIERLGSNVLHLRHQTDVDTPADFLAVCGTLPTLSVLMRTIRCLLASLKQRIDDSRTLIPRDSTLFTPHLRAPPHTSGRGFYL